MQKPKSISVTRLVRRMKNLLEIELGEVWVEGEVSNLRKQASGHQYFTLKDEGGQIPCVLFRGNASKLQFELEDGMQVLVFAEASLYEARGQVQLIVRKVEQQGQGDLQRRFELLKTKLSNEGLFAQEKKKQIPEYPESIGIITSPSAAALQDMLNVLKRRAPWIQPVLYPVQVQGNGAEQGIANAIKAWSDDDSLPQVDIIILGRGGGSIEDLWNFNEEVVARAIANCKIPVISAVGHEIDFTIADFVADLRAPTPSAAMELAVPDGSEIENQMIMYSNLINRAVKERLERSQILLDKYRQSLLARSPEAFLRESLLRVESLSSEMDAIVERKCESSKSELKMLAQRLVSCRPEKIIEDLHLQVMNLQGRLDTSIEKQLEKQQAKFEKLKDLHHVLGPDSAFARGFSVTRTAKGEIINSVSSVSKGDKVYTTVKDGEFESQV